MPRVSPAKLVVNVGTCARVPRAPLPLPLDPLPLGAGEGDCDCDDNWDKLSWEAEEAPPGERCGEKRARPLPFPPPPPPPPPPGEQSASELGECEWRIPLVGVLLAWARLLWW
jgi:hypothetical protein